MLSICIINYNTRALLESCIESIYDNKLNQFEIIVVDNASSDGSLEMIQNNFPNVKLISNIENKGYAKAVNQAVLQSRGEFILILNTDTKILPNAIENTLNFIDVTVDAGIVGCRILNTDKTLQKSCRSYPSLFNFISENFFLDKLFSMSRIFGKPFLSYFDYNKIYEVDVVLGAFMMIRKKTIQEIGLMDEQFFMYAEETDWCYRAKRAGWKVYFYPGAEIIHYGGESTKQNSLKMFIELHKSHHKFIKKYHGNLYLTSVKFVLISGLIIRVILFVSINILKSVGFSFQNDSTQKMKIYCNTLNWYFAINK